MRGKMLECISMKYYYLENGESKGAYTSAQILAFYNSGKITDNTLIAAEGSSDWVEYIQSDLAREHMDSAKKSKKHWESVKAIPDTPNQGKVKGVKFTVIAIEVIFYLCVLSAIFAFLKYMDTDSNLREKAYLLEFAVSVVSAVSFKALSHIVRLLHVIATKDT